MASPTDQRTSHQLVTILLLIVFVGIVLTDIATFWYPPAGILGSVLWMMSVGMTILASLYLLGRHMATLPKHHGYVTLGVLLILSVQLFRYTVNPGSLSGETTIEVGCAANHLTDSDDGGYHGTCLFGYPARQHYVAALPSLLLGRSMLALHVGTAILILCCVVIGSIALFEAMDRQDLATATILALVTHFRYVNHFAFFYEQGILAFSFALATLGLGYMAYRRSWPIHYTMLFLLFVLYLGSAYTSGLAIALPMMVLAIYLWWKSKPRNMWCLGSFAGMAIVQGISLSYRDDIHLAPAESQTALQVVADVLHGFRHLLIWPTGHAWSSLLAVGIVVLGMLLFVAKASWKASVMVMGWVAAIFLAAIVSKGYAVYSIDFRLHRAIVAVPILLAMLVYVYRAYDMHRLSMRLHGLLFFVVLTTGLWYQDEFLESREPNPHWEVVSWLMDYVPGGASTLYLSDTAEKKNNVVSVADSLRYFAPELMVNKDLDLEQARCLPTEGGLLLVSDEDKELCGEAMGNNTVAELELVKGDRLVLLRR